MRTILQGSKYLVYFRRLADKETKDASRLVFQTEVSLSKEKETEETPTVEGKNLSITDGAIDIDMSSLAYKDDTDTITAWREVETYFDNSDKVEVWLVPLEFIDDAGLVSDIRYYNGYLTSFELSAPSDGNVEISLAYQAEAEAFGEETLEVDQLAGLEDFRYLSLKAGGAPQPADPETP